MRALLGALGLAVTLVGPVSGLALAMDRRTLPEHPQSPSELEASGSDLYRTHCSPCHGATGRGDGAAARFLDPKPRDFQTEPIHFVATRSGAPSDHDLFEIISAGLPGTAMQGFAGTLNDTERAALIRVVREFQRTGAQNAAAGEDLGEDERRAWVASLTTPGESLRAPLEPPNTVESAARGRLAFLKLCASCHGPSGEGGIVPSTRGTEREIRARDLRRGVLKGGIEPGRLFVRLRRGIPGTPMPELPAASASDELVWDIVHYLGAVIPREAQRLHDPVGFAWPAARTPGKLPSDLQDAAFALAAESWVAFSPFAATASAEGVMVQAIHDGEHLGLRLRWADPTWNRPGTPTTTPPDGIAVRTTNQRKPPILPLPGQPFPLDRALWQSGPMPTSEDPWFQSPRPFENPDQVCRGPIGPERVGQGEWRDGYWTARLVVRPERGGGLQAPGKLQISFAVFDGENRAGPLPVGFSAWQELIILP